jgi:NAD(P)-dependent dehydrogenase (short-subunit alcohol dehydrogenase family)
MTLHGQAVVVIGGSSGIGRAVVERALAAGASVTAISRSGSAPQGARGVAADVTDRSALAQALQNFPTIDHLVHTTGARFASLPLDALPDDLLQLAFGTKLFSAIEAVRLALPKLAPTASVTLTSGLVSRKFGSGSFVKGALNAAVDAAGKHLAKELAPRRVNVVSPGVVDTDLWGAEGSEARTSTIARVATNLPVRRVGTPDELAQAYLFAMTNGFVTGTVIDVDGGGLL